MDTQTTSPRQFKDAMYRQLARIGKAVASGPRLELLDLLSQSPRTVDALAKQISQSVANTSHHLQTLRRARLVESQRDGVRVIYRVADNDVAAFFTAMRRLGESRLLEMNQVNDDFFSQRAPVEPIDRAVLMDRVKAGTVSVIDVRPRQEYDVGHLPGALSLPLAELEERIAELPNDRQVVAYCRGPYCLMALEAAQLLVDHGYDAVRFEEGVSDWRSDGLPVEVGA